MNSTLRATYEVLCEEACSVTHSTQIYISDVLMKNKLLLQNCVAVKRDTCCFHLGNMVEA